jgi:diguanylate cyclase (GGDEF)-like protein
MPAGYVTATSAALGAVGRRDRGLLIEMSGMAAGQVHVIVADEFTIGRSEKCTLRFDDTTMSRVHARIIRKEGQFEFEDLKSLNGSYINQEKVAHKALQHGDRIRFGSGARLQFQLVNQDEERILVHLYEAAVRDGLTGAYNRRYFDERLVAEVAHAVRYERELCALLLDVDHFKQVNDTHGHLAGDEVLRALANQITHSIRCEDLAARYGGEEFVVLARDIPVTGAACLAERLRKGISGMSVRFEDIVITVTASLGVAALSRVEKDKDGKTLLAAADAALYKAKETGRNRVVCA